MPVNITIDGRELQANDGETVLQTAKRHGIDIPHFCYHDKLSIAGNCRMCLVKVNGMPKLQPACNVQAAPKMTVETRNDEVDRARQQVLQFILLNHPVDCGICDKAGECSLQDNQAKYGPEVSHSRDPKLHGRKLYELSPRISLDNERCILCSRCVRFTREISKSNALGIVERGSHSYVDRLDDKPFDDPYSDNVIGICPVGALLSTEFLYKSRVWFLEPVRSVCTGCARGCSIDAWRRLRMREPRSPGIVKINESYRTTAFDNPEINGPWLCNKGFDMHLLMARERLLQPLVAGQPASPDEAIAAARQLLAQARNPAALVSAHASNEELDAFASLLGARLRAYARRDNLPGPAEVVEDDFLIKADKNPNSEGLRRRLDAPPLFEDAGRAAGHDLLLVWGELADREPLGDARVIHLATFGPATAAQADVAIPLSTHYERAGSYTNFEGKTNAFSPVFDKPPLTQHAADVFRRLAS